MAKIEVNIDYAQDMTVFKIIGTVNAGELLASSESYSEGEVTRLVLVDFTEATWSGISTADLKRNTATASKFSQKGNKSAFVFSSDADFGIGRMVEAFATIEKYENKFSMFRCMDEARKWLKAE